MTIDKVEFVKLDEPGTVYNFTVADFHTYYVTDIGIWVHNTNCWGKLSSGDLKKLSQADQKDIKKILEMLMMLLDSSRSRLVAIKKSLQGSLLVKMLMVSPSPIVQLPNLALLQLM
nr:polymorphic toxin-type HINT domain-containing protein [Paenibacillus roseus]